MTQPIGTEFIRILPDASGFRAALQAQVAGAVPAVQGQMAAAQQRITQATRGTAAGIILPSTVRSVEGVLLGVNGAQQKVAQSGTAAADSARKLTSENNAAANVTKNLNRGIIEAEREMGRYTRGMLAATAASTGFFRAVSFASGAFLLGAAAGASIASAIQEFTRMMQIGAQTTALIKATGGAANVTAGQVHHLSRRMMELTGIDDEQVQAAANVLLTFKGIRNEGEGMNAVFDRSVRSVLDISTTMGTDLLGTAKQVGKALQDPVRGMTALRRAGVTFSESERELVKRMVESNRMFAAQKFILAGIEGQIGGTAEAVGRTLPGRLRIMREEAKNALGEYVKRITESEQATHLFVGVSQGLSETFGAIKASIAAVGPSTLEFAKGIGRLVTAVGGMGPIIAIAAAYKAGAIAARAAATATGLYAAASATAARMEVVRATTVGTLTAETRAQALAEVTAARAAQARLSTMVALSSVFAAGAFASGQYTIAAIATTAALGSLAAKAMAARTALIATGQAATLSNIALATLGKGTSLASLAAVALVGTFLVLRREARNLQTATGTIGGFAKALDDLGESIKALDKLRTERGTAAENVSVARAGALASQKAVDAAQAALDRSVSQPGSLENIALSQRLAAARDKLDEANKKVAESTRTYDEVSERARIEQQRLQATIPKTTRNIRAQVREMLKAANVGPARTPGTGMPILSPRELGNLGNLVLPGDPFGKTRVSVEGLIEDFTKMAEAARKSGEPIKATVADALGTVLTYLQAINQMPTERKLEAISARIVRMAADGKSLNTIIRTLLFPGRTGVAEASSERVRLLGLQRETTRSVEDEWQAQKHVVNVLFEKRRTAVQNLRTQQEETRAAVDARDAARESLTSATRGLADAKQTLADAHQGLRDAIENLATTTADAFQRIREAVTAAKQATTEAIQSAKSNLDQLGQSVAEMLSKAGEELGASGKIDAATRARIEALKAQALAGGGGPGTQRVAQEIAFSLQSKTAAVDTSQLQKSLSLLTDDLNRGVIKSMPEFNKKLSTILSGAGIDLKQLRKIDPVLARRISDYLKALRTQARNILTAPKRPGGGDQPTVVNIQQVIQQGARDIADARKQAASDIKAANEAVRNAKRDIKQAEQAITDSNREVAKAQKDLREATDKLRKEQARETRLNTKATQANTRFIKEHNDLLRMQLKPDSAPQKPKSKPRGTAAQQSSEVLIPGTRP